MPCHPNPLSVRSQCGSSYLGSSLGRGRSDPMPGSAGANPTSAARDRWLARQPDPTVAAGVRAQRWLGLIQWKLGHAAEALGNLSTLADRLTMRDGFSQGIGRARRRPGRVRDAGGEAGARRHQPRHWPREAQAWPPLARRCNRHDAAMQEYAEVFHATLPCRSKRSPLCGNRQRFPRSPCDPGQASEKRTSHEGCGRKGYARHWVR